MKLILAATSTKQGNAKVAEIAIDRPDRATALLEGTAELLVQEQFPPEVVQVYREGLARGFSRDEVCDTILEQWGLQFFVQPDSDVSPKSLEQEKAEIDGKARLAQKRLDVDENRHIREAQPVPPRTQLTPRQLLQKEMRDLKYSLGASRHVLIQAQAIYDDLKARLAECKAMLEKAPKLKVVKRRKVASV